MNVGTYEEKLACGGTIKVNKSSWKISYYFSGPDMRYNGTFFSISGNKIEQYIQAYYNNFTEYEELKKSIPKGGEFSKTVQQGMVIRIGSFHEGVCITSYHMPISSKQKLDSLINGYKYAMERAPVIQSFLAKL